MQLDTNRTIGLYAPQDYGKSYMMKWLISIIAQHTPVYIYDTNYERYSLYKGMTNVNFIVAKDITKQETPAFFNKAILHLRAIATNCFLVVEDLDKLVASSGKTKDTLEVFKLASDSRHQRIGVIYATKEPTNIPVKWRSATNLFFIGQFLEPEHVKTLGKLVDKKMLTSLSKMDRSFIMLDRYTNTIKKVALQNDKLVYI